MITTENNLLKSAFAYGYGNSTWNLRTELDNNFNCLYHRAKYVPEDFKKECVKVANDISVFAKQMHKKPYVLFSGGLDSEIVIRSFLESGNDFEIIVNRFSHNLNVHETDSVARVCKELHLNPIYRDIDISSWLTSEECLSLADESKCTRAEMLPTMKLLKDVYVEMNGIPVLGNGDFYMSKDLDPVSRIEDNQIKYQWNYVEFEYILAWLRYAVKNEIQASINFFQQTPEILLCMANDIEFQKLVLENPLGRHTSRSRKYNVYKRYWPEILIREKFHGGENITNLCDYVQKKYLNNNYRNYTSKLKIPYEKFVSMIKPI